MCHHIGRNSCLFLTALLVLGLHSASDLCAETRSYLIEGEVTRVKLGVGIIVKPKANPDENGQVWAYPGITVNHISIAVKNLVRHDPKLAASQIPEPSHADIAALQPGGDGVTVSITPDYNLDELLKRYRSIGGKVKVTATITALIDIWTRTEDGVEEELYSIRKVTVTGPKGSYDYREDID